MASCKAALANPSSDHAAGNVAITFGVMIADSVPTYEHQSNITSLAAYITRSVMATLR